MATVAERRRIARLIHRFGFGPRPNEFSTLLSAGFNGAAEKILNAPKTDAFADSQTPPRVSKESDPLPIAKESFRMPQKRERN